MCVFAAPGPRLLDRLLGEVATRNRAGRRRFLFALAASVVLAAGGPAIALVAAHDSPSDQVAAADPPANQMARTDAATGVWAQVTTRDRIWGSEVEVQVKGDRFKARARTAGPEEKPEIWGTMVAEWPAYDEYQRSTEREIPVVVLERA